MGGGGKGGTMPDYANAANIDAATSQQNLATQTWANRPTIVTPWGTQTWQAYNQIDPATGKNVTSWGQDIQLSPQEQSALNAQQAIQLGTSDVAHGLLGQVQQAYSTPFDWQSLPGLPTQAAQSGNVQNAQLGAYNLMSQALQPGRTQQQSQLDTKLANMGLPMGSQANALANQQLQNQWTSEDKQMMSQAMGQGLQDVQSQYGMDQQQVQQQMQLQQAAIAQQAQQMGMPLNELNALLTGQQVGMPQFPGFNAAGVSAPSNLLGAMGQQGQFQLGQAGLQNQMIGGYGQLAGAAAAMGF